MRSLRDSLYITELTAKVREQSSGFDFRTLEAVGWGVASIVYRGVTRDGEQVAVKVPRQRWRPSENDGLVDSRWYLRREMTIYEFVRSHGVPTPEVLHVEFGEDDFDYSICAFVETDETCPSGGELGDLLALIHDLPLSSDFRRSVAGSSMAKVLAERLTRRVGTLYDLTGVRVQVPPATQVEALLSGRCNALLHLDVRPENFLTRNGRCVAVIDWDNALIGDPALELVRMDIFGDYAAIQSDALDRYDSIRGLPDPPEPVRDIYALDTAVMLAILFAATAPDEDRVAREMTRIAMLQQRSGVQPA